jgi:uncharacterized membrane protein YoaK (UPF0700 family)
LLALFINAGGWKVWHRRRSQLDMTMISTPPRRNRTRSFKALAHAIVAHRRLPMNDWLLATVLAAIAGAVNAGGFFVVGQYTSHMTGYLSQVADNLVTGHYAIVLKSLLAVVAFTIGAATSAALVNWARQNRYHQQYALPIVAQGFTLLAFSFAGFGASHIPILALLLMLCFLMGMQNATITKLSKARIRTTHATGMITDVGIEIGKAVFGVLSKNSGVRADTHKLMILLRLVIAFLAGGIVGAIGFASLGFIFAMPLSFVLLMLSLPTVMRPKRRLLAG